MQRYTIVSPLVAVRLSGTDRAGVMTSLPQDAVIEVLGLSNLAQGMIEIVWQNQRYAVFELDLRTRASLVEVAAVAGSPYGLTIES